MPCRTVQGNQSQTQIGGDDMYQLRHNITGKLLAVSNLKKALLNYKKISPDSKIKKSSIIKSNLLIYLKGDFKH